MDNLPERKKGHRRPTYPIAHDIPIPTDTKGSPFVRPNGLIKVYPWASMLPGDSFFVPYDEMPASGTNSFYAALSRYRALYDKTYTILAREVEGGVRIWRTK